MNIYYYSPRIVPTVSHDFRNFGDDLNETLWDHFFPSVFDNDNSTIFSGIGSHLNAGFASRFRTQHHVVFGTGYGYGDPITHIDKRWDVYFVRGPLTANSMGLPTTKAITDAAILIRIVFTPVSKRPHRVSVMPHINSISTCYQIWKALCDDLDCNLIDVRAPVKEVLEALADSQLVLTEALHGAIVADALRTPWIPLVSNPTISELKWNDWCQSIGVNYLPHRILPIWTPHGRGSFLRRLKDFVKYKRMRRDLARIRDDQHPYLSSDSKMGDLTERLQEAVVSFQKDWKVRQSMARSFLA